MFGKPPREIAIGAHEHRHADEFTGEHQGLVSGTREVAANAVGIAHDHDAVLRPDTRVPARENGRPLPHRKQFTSNRGNDRRLASTADGQVADTDHRPVSRRRRSDGGCSARGGGGR